MMVIAGKLTQNEFEWRKLEVGYVVVPNTPEAIKVADAFAAEIEMMDGSVYRYRVKGNDNVVLYRLDVPEDRDDECEQLHDLIGY